MSYSFSGSSQYLYVDEAPISAPPLLITAWFKTAVTTAASRSIAMVGDKDVNNHYHGLGLYQDDVYCLSRGGGSQVTSSRGNYPTNTWTFGAAEQLLSNSRYARLGTTRSTQNTSSITVSGADRISIGSRPSGADYFNGKLAHVCFWNITGLNTTALDSLMTALNSGDNPLAVSTSASLIRYYTLDDLLDHSGNGGTTLTNVSATLDTGDNPSVDPPPVSSRFKRWNGSTWEVADFKKHNGSIWVPAAFKKF